MLLGYKVFRGGLSNCISEMAEVLESCSEDSKVMACLNPHSFVVSQQDEKFAAALEAADWLVPDGVGILLAAKIMGSPIHSRITGSDIFKGLSENMNRSGGFSVFFLGSTEEVLSAMRARFEREYPEIEVVGTYSPPFKPVYCSADVEAMVDAVNASDADVLWVGMTAPKQEKWVAENISRLQVKLAGSIGAVFDFYAGRVARPQPLFQRLGLEWLPRLLREPRRLWRRTFVSAPVFLWLVAVERLSRR